MAEPQFPEDNDKEEEEEEEKDDREYGPDEMHGAEVYLPHGDRTEIAKVIGRKRNSEGLFVGRKNRNPILDSRIFIVEFPDGEKQEIAFNTLAEQLSNSVNDVWLSACLQACRLDCPSSLAQRCRVPSQIYFASFVKLYLTERYACPVEANSLESN